MDPSWDACQLDMVDRIRACDSTSTNLRRMKRKVKKWKNSQQHRSNKTQHKVSSSVPVNHNVGSCVTHDENEDKENVRIMTATSLSHKGNECEPLPIETSMYKIQRTNNITRRRQNLSPKANLDHGNDIQCSLMKLRETGRTRSHHSEKSSETKPRSEIPCRNLRIRTHSGIARRSLGLTTQVPRTPKMGTKMCSLCKTSSCFHLQPSRQNRSPCDGATSSPKRWAKLPDTDSLHRHASSFAISDQKDVAPSLPVAKQLQQNMGCQTSEKVLKGLSLRGLDGTDLSFIKSASNAANGHLNINDISCITTSSARNQTFSHTASAGSLRERLSNSDLTGSLHTKLHSTLNYPLSSTLAGIDGIPKDLSIVSEEPSECSSSDVSFDVDQSNTRNSNSYSFGSQESAKSSLRYPVSVKEIVRLDSQGNTSTSSSGSDSPILDDMTLCCGERIVVGAESTYEKHWMRRQLAQPTLQQARLPYGLIKSDIQKEEQTQSETRVAYDLSSNNMSMNATRDSSPDLDVTPMTTEFIRTISSCMEPQTNHRLSTKAHECCETDLEKTLQIGCIGRMKRTKNVSQNRRSKILDQSSETNLPNGCIGLSQNFKLTHTKNIVHKSKTKSKQILIANSPTKRQRTSANKKRKTQQRCRTPDMYHVNRRVSGILWQTPGQIHYELDSHLNVIQRDIAYQQKKKMEKKMPNINSSIYNIPNSGYDYHRLGHL